MSYSKWCNSALCALRSSDRIVRSMFRAFRFDWTIWAIALLTVSPAITAIVALKPWGKPDMANSCLAVSTLYHSPGAFLS